MTSRSQSPARGAVASAVLQLNLGAVEKTVVRLAVGAHDDFGFQLELAAGAAGNVVVIICAEELGIAPEAHDKLCLSTLRIERRRNNGRTSEKSFFHVRSLIGSESFSFKCRDETHELDRTQQ